MGVSEISEELKNYVSYLIYLNDKLSKFFESQKPYIFCHKGCAKCCKKAEFPYKKIEYDLLIEGFKTLPENIKNIIRDNVKNLKEERAKVEGKFEYTCPFLIDDVCSVYDFRGIICRSFGLMFYRENEIPGIPFCIFEGLNYSNVLNKETGIISKDKYKELGFEQEPLAFNVSHSFLTDEVIAKGFGFNFGETKPMIDWFSEEFYNV